MPASRALDLGMQAICFSISSMPNLLPFFIDDRDNKIKKIFVLAARRKGAAQPYLPFPSFKKIAPFALVHSNVWGPAPVPSLSGSRYYVIFVDDYSRFTWIYIMKHKSEVFSHFQAFRASVEKAFDRPITTRPDDLMGEENERLTHSLSTYGMPASLINSP